MNAVPFDTLKLARGLEEAGMSPQMAAGTVAALAEAMGSAELATKTDIGAVRAEMAAGFKAIDARFDMTDARIQSLETRFDWQFQSLETKFDGQIQSLETRFDGQIQSLETRFDTKLELLRRDITIRLGGMLIAATGIILAALRFMPHS
jgi:hypothetical protein